MFDLPQLGVGLGYRAPLHDAIIGAADRIDFLEFISDQYLYAPPQKLAKLVELGSTFPLIPHGVGMSVGTARPLADDFLHRLSRVVDAVAAPWFSDHLCFTKVPETDIEQLMPLWFTEESVDAVSANVQRVRRAIDRPFLLENITYYFPIPGNDMSEAQFITRVLDDNDIGLLLDVNNVWVNSVNLDFNPYEFLDSIPLERTVQIHLAGGREIGGIIADTHSTPVHGDVWKMLEHVLERAPVKGILLEWDQDFPEFQVLLDHLDQARELLAASPAGAPR